ncbi:MAG TPA: hypothetical protein VE685_07425 [Thermoanaerobaculia bacterium]|nr:hypothetical protein [Thermoanaerobaculia bacterium]
MKTRLFLVSLVLCLAVFGATSSGLTDSPGPIPMDLLTHLEKEGWTQVSPGVMQRSLGGNRIETLGFGAAGLRFQLQEMKANLVFLRKRHAESPSRDLRIAVRSVRAQILRIQEALRTTKEAEGLESSTGTLIAQGPNCSADYDATAFAFPLSQGVGANARTWFNNTCGYSGEVWAQAYAEARLADTTFVTKAQVDPVTAPGTPRFGGNISASASVSLPDGVAACLSRSYASVTNYDLGITYFQSDNANQCVSSLPAPWVKTDVGAVGLAGSASHADGKFRLTAGGTDIWDSADAFHFVHQSLTGDGEIVAHVSGLLQPAGATWTLGGVTFRQDLTAGSVHATTLIVSDGKTKFRRRTTTGGVTVSDGPRTGTSFPPRWLKLVRSGNVFTSFLSDDGVTWTQIHTPQTVAMANTVHVGLLALRGGSSAPAGAARFESVTVRSLPAPWQAVDVGTVGVAGKAISSGGTWTIQGGGMDIWDTTDDFHYVYQPLNGDGEIVANIAGLTVPTGATRSQAAVMIREKLSASSVHASMVISTDGKAKFRRRTTEGGTTLSDGPSIGSTYPPRWLKLVRSGNVFTAYLSSDGVTWTQIHTPQTVVMPANVWVGLAVLRDGTSTTPAATATIRDVQVVP